MSNYCWRLAQLSARETDTWPETVAITQRSLNEHVTTMTITSFRY